MNLRDELPDEELLSGYLDGELHDAERDRVEQWLRDSEAHRDRLRELQSLRDRLQSLPKHTLSADFSGRVVRQVIPQSTDSDAPPITPASPLARRRGFKRGLAWAAAVVAASVVIGWWGERERRDTLSRQSELARRDATGESDRERAPGAPTITAAPQKEKMLAESAAVSALEGQVDELQTNRVEVDEVVQWDAENLPQAQSDLLAAFRAHGIHVTDGPETAVPYFHFADAADHSPVAGNAVAPEGRAAGDVGVSSPPTVLSFLVEGEPAQIESVVQTASAGKARTGQSMSQSKVTVKDGKLPPAIRLESADGLRPESGRAQQLYIPLQSQSPADRRVQGRFTVELLGKDAVVDKESVSGASQTRTRPESARAAGASPTSTASDQRRSQSPVRILIQLVPSEVAPAGR